MSTQIVSSKKIKPHKAKEVNILVPSPSHNMCDIMTYLRVQKRADDKHNDKTADEDGVGAAVFFFGDANDGADSGYHHHYCV